MSIKEKINTGKLLDIRHSLGFFKAVVDGFCCPELWQQPTATQVGLSEKQRLPEQGTLLRFLTAILYAYQIKLKQRGILSGVKTLRECPNPLSGEANVLYGTEYAQAINILARGEGINDSRLLLNYLLAACAKFWVSTEDISARRMPDNVTLTKIIGQFIDHSGEAAVRSLFPNLGTKEVVPYYNDLDAGITFDTVCQSIRVPGIGEMPLYDILMGEHEKHSNSDAVDVIRQLGINSSTILEIGTGTGDLFSKINQLFPDASLTGVDLSPGMLKMTRSRNRNADSGNYLQADAQKLPIATNSVDLVVSSYLIDLLYSHEAIAVIGEIERALAPGGYAVFINLTNRVDGRGTIRNLYFKIINEFYKKLYDSTTARRISEALFDGYYTHCRPIDTLGLFSESGTNLQLVGTYDSNISLGGLIPFLPVTISVIRKDEKDEA